MVSLFIPDDFGRCYGELKHHKLGSYYDIINSLSSQISYKGNKISISPEQTCHIDPDLRRDTFAARPEGWKPVFGQCGSAGGHLINQKVAPGDLFLFFGTFAETGYREGKLKYVPGGREFHALYGYLQIGEIIKSDSGQVPAWLRYHPHADEGGRFLGKRNNLLFIARDRSTLNPEFPGAGVFKFSPRVVLTSLNQAPGEYKKSVWELDDSLNGAKFTYHSKPVRTGAPFKSAGRGQEFVTESKPEVQLWAGSLIRDHTALIA